MILRPSILAAAALAAGLLTLGVAASPAMAQEISVRVSYADLNLASDSGREILDRRIANAADQLCGAFSPLELTWAAAVRACQAETIALTQPQRDAALRHGTVQISSADRAVRVSRAAN
jgi:UrcA family protein